MTIQILKTILNNISAKLDTETVTELNAKVDVDGQEYTDVAKEYYDSIKRLERQIYDRKRQ